MDLENIFREHVKIVQYADDICIYIIGKDIDLLNIKMREAINRLIEWLENNGLKISARKSQICTFSSKKFHHKAEFKVDSLVFPYVDSVRFLGMQLDQKLTFNEHIKTLIGKAERSLNVLKAICHTKYGPDPNISLMVYKAYTRSILDFGSTWYSQAKNTNLQKLDKVHNKGLRICLQLLKSTPIDILMAESGEVPLSIRRKFLADKYIIKLYECKSPLYDRIQELSIRVLTAPIIISKPTPIIVSSYSDTREFVDLLGQIPVDPRTSLWKHVNRNVQIKIPNLRDYSTLPDRRTRNICFEYDIDRLYNNQCSLMVPNRMDGQGHL